MCEGYINSMEKCAECDNIRYEKCEITAKYPMKNVEQMYLMYNVRYNI